MQIAILLGTYNGAAYLQDQLNSYLKQSHNRWTLWASDDGSTDSTYQIIENFAKQIGENRLYFVAGPRSGFAANFLSLVCNPRIQADAYAYSDQDDIWMEDKLKRATEFLSSISKDIPALYCSRTLYVDQNDNPMGVSQAYSKPAAFQNALIQNIASGNTMVFNDAARTLMLRAGSNLDLDLHDWWTYLLITGAGGQVFFDQEPTVRYRQHAQNIIGMNTNFKAKMMRIRLLFEGRFADWNERHIVALQPVEDLLTNQNRVVFHRFVQARRASFLSRLVGLKRSGVYRQTFLNNIGFWVAAIVGKV